MFFFSVLQFNCSFLAAAEKMRYNRISDPFCGGGVRSGGQGAPRSGAPPPTTYL